MNINKSICTICGKGETELVNTNVKTYLRCNACFSENGHNSLDFQGGMADTTLLAYTKYPLLPTSKTRTLIITSEELFWIMKHERDELIEDFCEYDEIPFKAAIDGIPNWYSESESGMFSEILDVIRKLTTGDLDRFDFSFGDRADDFIFERSLKLASTRSKCERDLIVKNGDFLRLIKAFHEASYWQV